MSSTPPWEVGSWDLRGDLEKVTQQWATVREILEDAPLFALRDPAVSAWSCGEQAGHVLLVAQAMARTIEGNLAEPDRDRDREWTAYARPVLEGGRIPRGRAKSPLRLDTTGRPREEFAGILPEVIEAWERLGTRPEALRTCPARARHFAFGYLTSAEWVRMCAVHTAHHLAIVRDIRSA